MGYLLKSHMVKHFFVLTSYIQICLFTKQKITVVLTSWYFSYQNPSWGQSDKVYIPTNKNILAAKILIIHTTVSAQTQDYTNTYKAARNNFFHFV